MATNLGSNSETLRFSFLAVKYKRREKLTTTISIFFCCFTDVRYFCQRYVVNFQIHSLKCKMYSFFRDYYSSRLPSSVAQNRYFFIICENQSKTIFWLFTCWEGLLDPVHMKKISRLENLFSNQQNKNLHILPDLAPLFFHREAVFRAGH